MKIKNLILPLLLLFWPTYLMSQEYLAINYDSINSLNVYKAHNEFSEIIGIIEKYELYICELDSSNLLKIKGFKGQNGYISRKYAKLISEIPINEQKILIIKAFDEFWKQRIEHDAIIVGASDKNLEKKMEEIEDFNSCRLFPLLPILKNHICERGDEELLINFLQFLSTYYQLGNNKEAMWILLDCYLCQSDLLISIMDKFGLILQKTYIEQLNFAFENSPHNFSKQIDLKTLREKFQKWAEPKMSQEIIRINKGNRNKGSFPSEN
jgi:hypothetical protein